jgi:dTDP-4-amino-4,6-dideoxygalactose transaminase
MTFAASGESVLYFRARPVLIDCDPDSFHMDPALIEAAITPRTRAIMPVHYGGYPCEMDAILEIARRRRLHVIEDAAHAFPSRYKGRSVGTLGDITCFSFYATKTLTTGEGGMLVTDNENYADCARILSLHGISRDAWKRYTSHGSWRYDIDLPGFKYNLTDLAAAIGIVQLQKAEQFRERRTELAARYASELASLSSYLTLPSAPAHVQHAWHLYVIQINEAALRISRDEVIEQLKARSIGSSVHFIPLHLHPLYRNHCGYRTGQFPNAERRFASAISLPLFPDMSTGEQDRVIRALQEIVRNYAR